MKQIIEPLKNWFGFTRGERRSSLILLAIIIIIILARYVVPGSRITAEDVTSSVIYDADSSMTGTEDSIRQIKFFSFNPNKVSYDTLLKLGLSGREASTLISYRKNGGKFRLPSDLKKVYGINIDKAEKLMPYVEIEPDTFRKVFQHAVRKRKPPTELNRCDSAALDSLPGIGPVLSSRIIKYRNLIGGFAKVEQLKEVYGLQDEIYSLISSKVTADSSYIVKININSATYRELSRLPYFEKYEITALLKYRELKGRITNITELVENKIIPPVKAVKIAPYLKF